MGKRRKTKRNQNKKAAVSSNDKGKGKKDGDQTTQSSNKTSDEIQEKGHSLQNVTKQRQARKKTSDNVQAAGHSSQESKMASERFDCMRSLEQDKKNVDKELVKIIKEYGRKETSMPEMMPSETPERKVPPGQHESRLNALVQYKQHLNNIMESLDPKSAENVNLKSKSKRSQKIRDYLSSEKETRTNVPKNEQDEEMNELKRQVANKNYLLQKIPDLFDFQFDTDFEKKEGKKDAYTSESFAEYSSESLIEGMETKEESNRITEDIGAEWHWPQNVNEDEKNSSGSSRNSSADLEVALQFIRNEPLLKDDSNRSTEDVHKAEKNLDCMAADNVVETSIKITDGIEETKEADKDVSEMKLSNIFVNLSSRKSEQESFEELHRGLKEFFSKSHTFNSKSRIVVSELKPLKKTRDRSKSEVTAAASVKSERTDKKEKTRGVTDEVNELFKNLKERRRTESEIDKTCYDSSTANIKAARDAPQNVVEDKKKEEKGREDSNKSSGNIPTEKDNNESTEYVQKEEKNLDCMVADNIVEVSMKIADGIEESEGIEKDVTEKKHSDKMANLSKKQNKNESFKELEGGLQKYFSKSDAFNTKSRSVAAELKPLKQKRDRSKSEITAAAMVKSERTEKKEETRGVTDEVNELFKKLKERRAESEKDKTCCDSSTANIKAPRDAPQNVIEGKKKEEKGRKDINKSSENIPTGKDNNKSTEYVQKAEKNLDCVVADNVVGASMKITDGIEEGEGLEKDVTEKKHSDKMAILSTRQNKNETFKELKSGLQKYFSKSDTFNTKSRSVAAELKPLKQKRDRSKSEITAAAVVKSERNEKKEETRGDTDEVNEVFKKLKERRRVESENGKTCCDSSTANIKAARDAPQNVTEGKKKEGKGREDSDKSSGNIQAVEEGSLSTELVLDEDATEIMPQLEEGIGKAKDIPEVGDLNTTAKRVSEETKEEKLHDDNRRYLEGFLMFQESQLDEQVKFRRVMESEIEILGEQRNLLSSEKVTVADVSKAEEQGVKTETREESSIKAETEYNEEQRVTTEAHQQQEISKKAEPHKEQEETETEINMYHRPADQVSWLKERIIILRNTDKIRFEIQNDGNKHIFVGDNRHFLKSELKEVVTFATEDGAVKVSFIGKQVLVSTLNSEFDISVRDPHAVALEDDEFQTDL